MSDYKIFINFQYNLRMMSVNISLGHEIMTNLDFFISFYRFKLMLAKYLDRLIFCLITADFSFYCRQKNLRMIYFT